MDSLLGGVFEESAAGLTAHVAQRHHSAKYGGRLEAGLPVLFEHRLADVNQGIEADEVGGGQGPHRVAEADLARLVDVFGGGRTALHHTDGVEDERNEQTIDDEAWCVPDANRKAVDGVAERHRRVGSGLRGALRGDDLDQTEDGGRVEEVEADDTLRSVRSGGQGAEGEGGSVAGQDGLRLADAAKLCEEVFLRGNILDDGLNDQVTAAQVLDVCGALEAAQGTFVALLGEAASIDVTGQPPLDGGKALVQALLIHLQHGHVVPVGCADLSDTAAHDSAPHDADQLDRHSLPPWYGTCKRPRRPRPGAVVRRCSIPCLRRLSTLRVSPGNGHEFALPPPSVDLPRPSDLLLLVHDHLPPLGDPPGHSANGEQDWIQVHRKAHRLIDYARVEVDVGVELALDEVLVFQGDALQLQGDIQQGVPSGHLEDSIGRLLDDLGPGVIVLVDAVPEPHEQAFAAFEPLHVLRDPLLVPDIGEHSQHRSVGAPVQRPVQACRCARRRRERVYLRAPNRPHGVGAAVLLVVSVQNEQNVERFLQYRVRLVLRLGHLPHHGQEVARVAQIVVRIDVGKA